jgi:hypothetical protein
MEAKQVFSAYGGKEDGGLGRFKYCPYCGTQLALKANGGKPRPACPNCGIQSAFAEVTHTGDRAAGRGCGRSTHRQG